MHIPVIVNCLHAYAERHNVLIRFKATAYAVRNIKAHLRILYNAVCALYLAAPIDRRARGHGSRFLAPLVAVKQIRLCLRHSRGGRGSRFVIILFGSQHKLSRYNILRKNIDTAEFKINFAVRRFL